MRVPCRARSLLLAALLATACSSDHSSPSAVAAGPVDLTGHWRLVTAVTAATDTCSADIAAALTGARSVRHDPLTGSITVRAAELDLELVGTAADGRGALAGSLLLPDGAQLTYDLAVTYTAAGLQAAGNVTSTGGPGGTCSVQAALAGERLTTASYLTRVRYGDQALPLRHGIPDLAGAAPPASAAGVAVAFHGGTGVLGVEGARFDRLQLSVLGTSDWYEVVFPTPPPVARLVLQFAPRLPDGPEPTFPDRFQLAVVASLQGVLAAPRLVTVDRLEAGTGSLQVHLAWDSPADLDLVLVEPDGTVIFHGAPVSPSGGELDVDGNASCVASVSAENITYGGFRPPRGTYIVLVDHFANCGAVRTDFALRVNIPGRAPVLAQGAFTGAGSGGAANAARELLRFVLP